MLSRSKERYIDVSCIMKTFVTLEFHLFSEGKFLSEIFDKKVVVFAGR